MKAWFAVAALVLSSSALAQKQLGVDLDAPGALEALARTNPAHFAKVERILREAPKRPLSSVGGWMKTQFNAQQVSAPYFLKTSLPAQARISFILDDTHYQAVIRVESPR